MNNDDYHEPNEEDAFIYDEDAEYDAYIDASHEQLEREIEEFVKQFKQKDTLFKTRDERRIWETIRTIAKMNSTFDMRPDLGEDNDR